MQGLPGRTNVGGQESSFGIWHEHAPAVQNVLEKHTVKVKRIHTHIGSGSDPAVWMRVSELSLNLCRLFPDVSTLNLGGGYKVARVVTEKSTDLQVIGQPVRVSVSGHRCSCVSLGCPWLVNSEADRTS